MLSSQAFNAFLKTLEEPPKHAVFIMATTEKQKILPTILSRCQTYDFQRISNADIVAQLARIAGKEGIKADPQALQVIARKADGGMRDALSIFDQIASFTGGNLTYQATIDNLNILDYELFFRLTDAALQGNVPAALMMLDSVIRRGFDPQHFIGGWASHIRDLMVSTDPATLQLIEAGAEIAHKYQEQATKCSPQFLFYGLQIANECDFNYKNSRNKRLSVELAICRICQIMHPIGPAPEGPRPLQSAAQPSQPQPQVAKSQSSSVTESSRVVTQQQPAMPHASSATPVQRAIMQPVPSDSGTRFTPQAAMGAGRRMTSIKNSTSLQSGIQNPPAQQQVEEQNDPVDPSALMGYWKQFAQESSGEHLLVGVINECYPESVSPDNLHYIVKLISEDQKKLIEDNLNRIVSYLVSKVHNTKLSIELVVEDSSLSASRLYTPREKFQAISEQYSELVDAVSQQFNIELA